MSDKIRLPIGWADHPALRDRQKPSRRGAWIRLIECAAHAEFGNLRQGEVARSSRVLAHEWKWSLSAVQRFIRDLERHGIIERRIEHGAQIIIIRDFRALYTEAGEVG